jgi:16S rRNA (uracil1498-N3)-methyltransferase
VTERFYLPTNLGQPEVEASGSEAHHMLNVLRLKPGADVVLFDGCGVEAAARIVECGRSKVRLSIQGLPKCIDQSVPQVLVASAVPKGDRFRWLVEKTTELGVTRLIPLRTSRSVVVPGAGKLEKLRQTVVAACKQSGRNDLMTISSITAWVDFVSAEIRGKNVLIAHPGGCPFSAALAEDAANTDNAVVVAIGPEGGFDDDEIHGALQAGATLVSLGPRILRIETAAIAMATVLGLLKSE